MYYLPMIYTEYGSISDICLVGFISPFLFSLVTTAWVFCFFPCMCAFSFFCFIYLNEWNKWNKICLFISASVFLLISREKNLFILLHFYDLSFPLSFFFNSAVLHSCHFSFFPYMSFCFFLLCPISLISLSSHWKHLKQKQTLLDNITIYLIVLVMNAIFP